LAGAGAEGSDQAFAADFGQRDFEFRSLGGGDEFLLEVAEAAFFVLADELANVFAGRAPIAGSDLAFDVLFQGFGREMLSEVMGMAS
jgi:hypothetical protein